MKGGIFLPATGYIQVRAYSSFAQLPLKDVSVAITAADGTAIAMALTDRSGKITPVSIPVPPLADSQTPGSADAPFTVVNIHARLRGYEQIRAEGVQVFADTVTLQNLEMIPLAEFPTSWDQSEDFDTPPQNL